MNPLDWIGADTIPDAMQGPIPDLALLAGLLGWMHHHRCHETKCWRMGHQQPDGTVKCRRHH